MLQGSVKFVLFDEEFNKYDEITIGHNLKYSKILIPKNIWYAFKGISDKNLIVNALKKRHSVCKMFNLNLKNNKITYKW